MRKIILLLLVALFVLIGNIMPLVLAQGISPEQKFVKLPEQKTFLTIAEEDNTIYLSFDKNKNILTEKVLNVINKCLIEKGFSYSEFNGFYITDAKIVADKLYVKKIESGEYFSIEDIADACWNKYVIDRPAQVFPIYDSVIIFGELERERRENDLEIVKPIIFDIFGFPKEIEVLSGRWFLLPTNGSIKCSSKCFIGKIGGLDREEIKIENGTISFEKGKPTELTNYLGTIFYSLPVARLIVSLNKEGLLELNYPKKFIVRFKPNETQEIPLIFSYQRESVTSIKFNEIEKPILFSIENLIKKQRKDFSIASDVGLEIKINHNGNIISLEGPSFSIDDKRYTSNNKIEIDLNKELKLKTSMQIGNINIDTGLTYNKETDTHSVDIRKFRQGATSSKGIATCALTSGGDTSIKVVTGSLDILGQTFGILGLNSDSTRAQITNIIKGEGINGLIKKGLEVCDSTTINFVKDSNAPLIYTYIKEPIKAFYIRDIVKEEVEKTIRGKEIAGIDDNEKEYIIDLVTEHAAIVLGEEINENQDKVKKLVIDFYVAFRKNDRQGMTNAYNNLIGLQKGKEKEIRERVINKAKKDSRIKELGNPVGTLINQLWPFGRLF